MQATITESPFGKLPDGREATLYTLTNANGMVAKISNLGGVITELHVPDRDGVLADVCHGFDNVTPYMGDSHYFGALIGRYGNRIANGRFTLDGKTYQLPLNDKTNSLHGGTTGFDKAVWRIVSVTPSGPSSSIKLPSQAAPPRPPAARNRNSWQT